MRRVPIEYVREGHYNAKPIYTAQGQLLIRDNVMLTESYLNKLRAAGYHDLFIQDEYCESEIKEIIQPHMLKQMEDLTKSISKLAVSQTNARDKKMQAVEYVQSFEKILDEIINDLINDKEVVNNLLTVSIYDDYTFKHSINLMSVALAMGNELGMTPVQLKSIAMGSVFHDIGKIFVPKSIINKPGKLTEEQFELIKEHPKKGFEFMRDYTNLSAVGRIIALEHHEKVDGTGYPEGKKGNDIQKISKLCSVADVFEALIAERPYRRAVDLGEAREYIMGNGGTAFDMEMVECFTRAINPYPKDTRVRLSDGREGIVVSVHKEFYSRPKILILCEENKKVTPYEVDLVKDRNVVITSIIYRFGFEPKI